MNVLLIKELLGRNAIVDRAANSQRNGSFKLALFSGQLFMLAYDGQRGQWAMRLGGGAQQPGPGVANTQLLVGR